VNVTDRLQRLRERTSYQRSIDCSAVSVRGYQSPYVRFRQVRLFLATSDGVASVKTDLRVSRCPVNITNKLRTMLSNVRGRRRRSHCLLGLIDRLCLNVLIALTSGRPSSIVANNSVERNETCSLRCCAPADCTIHKD